MTVFVFFALPALLIVAAVGGAALTPREDQQ
jgi:hypothetical protein